jgi:hypothetical protein
VWDAGVRRLGQVASSACTGVHERRAARGKAGPARDAARSELVSGGGRGGTRVKRRIEFQHPRFISAVLKHDAS